MVALGVVERPIGRWANLRGDGAVATLCEHRGICRARAFHDLALLVSGEVNGAAVLGAHVIALLKPLCWVVLLPESPQDLQRGDLLRSVGN